MVRFDKGAAAATPDNTLHTVSWIFPDMEEMLLFHCSSIAFLGRPTAGLDGVVTLPQMHAMLSDVRRRGL